MKRRRRRRRGRTGRQCRVILQSITITRWAVSAIAVMHIRSYLHHPLRFSTQRMYLLQIMIYILYNHIFFLQIHKTKWVN